MTAVAAVVTVVVLGVPLVQGTGGDAGVAPPTVTPTAPRLATASQVLLWAAVQQEVDEKVSGKFFRVRSLYVSRNQRRTISESWMPAKRGRQSWFGWVDLVDHPKPNLNKMSFAEVPPGYYLTGDKPLSAQQIAALPTDPVKLRALLASAAGPGASADQLNYTVFTAAGRLLFEMPSPPKLRGAALRVLAALPDTKVRADVKDPIGRTGTEISIDVDLSRPGANATIYRFGDAKFIIDPATGRLLSSVVSGPKPLTTVVLESGWTDETPTAPAPAIR
ncbi:hypothetical protein EV646_110266 [Kribbella antiqua]|uniref:Uncharacterized protein n=1 Tax=Kribbella antiqua TaxID=2512217 RepID=A0A4R2IJL8_9ACTN|nr:CU044_5270 family protein [Kribbella antiqua]TCO44552.1 hypothetical protein EV646_110266 [Kribbella antiqua]